MPAFLAPLREVRKKVHTAMKKVIIVGAGVSGLSAGVYAAKSGFDVTILEKHTIPGGLSTSWRRKGYLFEGGMHWLTGSSEKLALNKVWRETGALKENNPIYYRDPFYTLQADGRELRMYRDVDKLESELIRWSPEDKNAVRSMCRDIRLFKGVHLVVSDIPFLKTRCPVRPGFFELLCMAIVLIRLPFLLCQSYPAYLSKFKDKNIRHLLTAVIGTRYNALSFVYTLASFASGDCGYPIGGSLRMTKNMADTFESLGGKIEYRKEVSKIVVKNRMATGVIAAGEFIPADAVIVTQDARKAVETLFDIPLNRRWLSIIRRHIVTEQNMFVCLGIKADLKKYPRGIILPLATPLCAGGLEFSELRINNYAEYENHSPDGCTALTCLLLGDSYAYWKKAKEDGTYKQKKQELAETVIALLEDYMPELKDAVEVIDVATPLTYERYCNSYEGSWMSVWLPGRRAINVPIKSLSVRNLYFAGQRTMMPGGLPIAVASGRKAVQYLCRDNKSVFLVSDAAPLAQYGEG